MIYSNKNDNERNALKRGLVFELSPKQFEELTAQDCVYCGDSPTEANYLSKSTKKYGGFKANGVDRKINAVGYTVENSQPCCTTCNMMKKVLSDTDFLNQISKINKHQKRKRKLNG